MCKRYTVRAKLLEIIERFIIGLEPDTSFSPTFNAAPLQPMPVVVPTTEGRELRWMHWGLIPRWAKDGEIAHKTYNARSETLAEKPSFRDAYKKRRCIVPADGFYEWSRKGSTRQPHFIHRRDDALFAFAGLWERWLDPVSETPRETFTIATVPPNPLVGAIHNRMPAVLHPDHEAGWLDHSAKPPAIVTWPADDWVTYPVSEGLEDRDRYDQQCIAPFGQLDLEGM